MAKTRFEDKVLRGICECCVVGLLEQLVAFPSVNPPGHEFEIAQFVAKRLEELRFRVTLQDAAPGRPNVIGIIGNGGKRLVFNTHLDVVPATSWNHGDPFTPCTEQGKLYGRGAADPKGALAAMIVAAQAVIESGAKPTGELAVTAVVDEECASLGAKSLFRTFRGDYGVVGEPTSLTPMIAHRGSLRLVVASKGKAAHSAMPQKGVNAIYEMVPVLRAIETLQRRLVDKSHRLCGSPTLTVTQIHGGEKENMIPDRCEIMLDRRLIPGEDPVEALKEIEETLRQLKEEGGPDSEIVRTIETTGGAAETDEHEPIVRIAESAVKDIVGYAPMPGGMAIACDMIHLTTAGIPTVILGPGDIALAHTADEHIDVQELVLAAKIYALLILRTVCQGAPEI